MGFLTARMTILKKTSLLIMIASVLVLWGCSDSTPHSTGSSGSQPKTNQFETGRFALQKMIPAARFWAPDAQPVQLTSTATGDSNGQHGKAILWRATFGSRTRLKSEPFTWSGMADASRGVDHGVEDTFNPANRTTQLWDLNFLKVDTDQAFDVAQQHGGAQLLEKDPKLPVTYFLDFDAYANQLRWHVIYGNNESKDRLTVQVDATTGQFLRKE